MRVFFLRHGESVDDVENRFGGWADFPLTEKGKKQADDAAKKLVSQKLVFDAVYSSPLKRAAEAAQIIHCVAQTPRPEVCELFKERNTYGILTGLTKTEAKQKFPEEYAKRERDEWVLGSERFEDAATRMRAGIDFLKKSDPECVLVVTHGGMLRAFYEGIRGQNFVPFGDCEFREETI